MFDSLNQRRKKSVFLCTILENSMCLYIFWGFPVGSEGNKWSEMQETAQVRFLGREDALETRREWLPNPVFLPGEVYG